MATNPDHRPSTVDTKLLVFGPEAWDITEHSAYAGSFSVQGYQTSTDAPIDRMLVLESWFASGLRAVRDRIQELELEAAQGAATDVPADLLETLRASHSAPIVHASAEPSPSRWVGAVMLPNIFEVDPATGALYRGDLGDDEA